MYFQVPSASFYLAHHLPSLRRKTLPSLMFGVLPWCTRLNGVRETVGICGVNASGYPGCIILRLRSVQWRPDADLRVQVREWSRLRRDAKAVRRSRDDLQSVRGAGQEGTPPGGHLVQGLGLLLHGLQRRPLEGRDHEERRIGR